VDHSGSVNAHGREHQRHSARRRHSAGGLRSAHICAGTRTGVGVFFWKTRIRSIGPNCLKTEAMHEQTRRRVEFSDPIGSPRVPSVRTCGPPWRARHGGALKQPACTIATSIGTMQFEMATWMTADSGSSAPTLLVDSTAASAFCTNDDRWERSASDPGAARPCFANKRRRTFGGSETSSRFEY
jgi:hypothetical protein